MYEEDYDLDDEQELGFAPGSMPQTGILPVMGGVPSDRQTPRNMSMADVLKDNWGMLGTVGLLSMLANNNGRRGVGQLIGRAGIDALGALGKAGMLGMQQDRLDAQNAATRADRALSRQIQLQNLALRMQTAQGKANAAAQEAAFNAALNGGVAQGGGYAPSGVPGAAASPSPLAGNPFSILLEEESGGDWGNVSPDRDGSWSFGGFQLNSLPGNSMHGFMPFLSKANPELYRALGSGTLSLDSKAFHDAWKAAAAGPLRGDMEKAQTQYFEQTMLQRTLKSLQGTGMEGLAQNPAFMQMLASTVAQHGQGGASRIFRKAWGKASQLPQDQQLEALVRGVYGAEGRANPAEFVSMIKQDPTWMDRVGRPRFEREMGKVLGLMRGGQGTQSSLPAGSQQGGAGEIRELDAQIERLRRAIPYAPSKEARLKAESQMDALYKRRSALVGDKNNADADQERIWNAAERLRKEYAGVSAPYLSLGQNLRDIMTSVKAGNGVGDIATVFQFMKALDPQSVVREGEVAMAQRTAGVPEYIANMLNKFFKGETLNAEQRRQFVQFARGAFANAERAQRMHDDRYRGLATRRGVSPEDVLYSPYSTLGSEADEWLNANPAAPSATPGAPTQGGTTVPGKPQYSIPKPSATGPRPAPAAASPQQGGNPAGGMSDEELQRQLGLTPRK